MQYSSAKRISMEHARTTLLKLNSDQNPDFTPTFGDQIRLQYYLHGIFSIWQLYSTHSLHR